MNSDPTVWWKECTLVFSDADGGFVCFAADEQGETVERLRWEFSTRSAATTVP